MKKKRKKKGSPFGERTKKTVSYVCSNCDAKEGIPEEVLEMFDREYPDQSILYGYHQLKCEKCRIGIMSPEVKPEVIVKGYGLFEGLDFKPGKPD